MKKQKPEKRWLSDVELAAALGHTISVSFLRKDRVGEQRIPFHKIGRLTRYDQAEVNGVIEQSRFGGKAAA